MFETFTLFSSDKEREENKVQEEKNGEKLKWEVVYKKK